MTAETIREHFPQLKEQVFGKPLVYLDNAATSLRPTEVIDKWEEVSLKYNANIHRAVHRMSSLCTAEYENTRAFVKEYLSCPQDMDVVFTSGTTNSINLVAYSFGEKYVDEGDCIAVTEADHHSNIVPWYMLCQRKGAILKTVKVKDSGELDIDSLEDILKEGRVRIVCLPHISNVLGIVNPIKEVVELCHSYDCPVLVDGAQGIVHCKPNFSETDCDFYAFSGHKVYAAPGTGVLCAKKRYLDQMPPFMGGGEMIESVSWEKITYAPSPMKFEAGTQNFASVPTLVPALKLAEEISQNIDIQKVVNFVKEELASDDRIVLYGNPVNPSDKIPLFSFCVKEAHHEDLALLLDKMGIAVRSGQMCAEPLMTRLGVTGMLRASFAPYNTIREAEYFIESLDRAIKMLVG